MKITKFGHCCLLIETKGKRILTDPGFYTAEAHSKLENLDYILFTHEHQDHYHLESLKILLTKNPQVKIYTNHSLSALLTKENIAHEKIDHNQNFTLGEIRVVGIGEKHAQMHSSVPQADNIGFFIDGRLWYPGDAFTNPDREVEILALPVAGPWMKVSQAIDYAILLKPQIAFGVHDGIGPSFAQDFCQRILPNFNLKFIKMLSGDSHDFK